MGCLSITTRRMGGMSTAVARNVGILAVTSRRGGIDTSAQWTRTMHVRSVRTDGVRLSCGIVCTAQELKVYALNGIFIMDGDSFIF